MHRPPATAGGGRLALALALALTLGLPAGSVAGEAALGMPPALQLDGTSVVLNGSAIRKKLFIQVYELGVYVPELESDAETIISADTPKALRMRLMVPLGGATIGRAIARGFERNDGDRIHLLEARLARLEGLLPRLAAGDDLLLRWSPGEGTVIELRGERLGVIEGKDFSDALMRCWLGPVTGDSNLKAELLAGAGRSSK